MESIGILLIVVLGILWIVGIWKVFSKAGKPGWAVIIPIYNIFVLLEIVGKPAWWFFLFLIPGVDVIIAIWVINLLSKSYGYGVLYTIGLLLFPFIFFPLIGLGGATYRGPAGNPAAQTA